jgi:DNA polymerase elongation subunit (family B)
MQKNDKLLEQLEQILHFKKSKKFYAERLGITEEEVNELFRELRTGEEIKENKTSSKMLLLDIETSPLLSFTFGVWKQNIRSEQLVNDWFILCAAAKWFDEDEIFSLSLTPDEVFNEDDSEIMYMLWGLLDEADVVITHNGKSFDIPRINTRFLIHGMTPPSPYKQIDTLEAARKHFSFTSNRLDYINKFLGMEGKKETDFQLWRDCVRGNEEAMAKMEDYNRNDVVILENAYKKIRPYIFGHPNMDIYEDGETPVCTLCGSHNIRVVENKYFYTQSVKYALYKCDDCGGFSRAKKGEKFENKKVISAIPR